MAFCWILYCDWHFLLLWSKWHSPAKYIELLSSLLLTFSFRISVTEALLPELHAPYLPLCPFPTTPHTSSSLSSPTGPAVVSNTNAIFISGKSSIKRSLWKTWQHYHLQLSILSSLTSHPITDMYRITSSHHLQLWTSDPPQRQTSPLHHPYLTTPPSPLWACRMCQIQQGFFCHPLHSKYLQPWPIYSITPPLSLQQYFHWWYFHFHRLPFSSFLHSFLSWCHYKSNCTNPSTGTCILGNNFSGDLRHHLHMALLLMAINTFEWFRPILLNRFFFDVIPPCLFPCGSSGILVAVLMPTRRRMETNMVLVQKKYWWPHNNHAQVWWQWPKAKDW